MSKIKPIIDVRWDESRNDVCIAIRSCGDYTHSEIEHMINRQVPASKSKDVTFILKVVNKLFGKKKTKKVKSKKKVSKKRVKKSKKAAKVKKTNKLSKKKKHSKKK